MTDQYHLEQVSRSFAVSIQALHEPLKEYIGLAYLLCRVVDTVEDARWFRQSAQEKAFSQFESFLIELPSASEFEIFRQSFPSDLIREEQELIDDSFQLFVRYHQLPVDIRQCMQNPILSMSRGMKFFIFRDFTKLKLRSLLEVDQYCFFVAGVVGELLTNLANRISLKRNMLLAPVAPGKQEPFSLVEAYHFALFLQKVNILKDKDNDEKSGRFLLPEVGEVWRQLENHSDHAFNYIDKIPPHLSDFKLFCSWALFLGLNALAEIVVVYEKTLSCKTESIAKQAFNTAEQGFNTTEQAFKKPTRISREQAVALFSQLQQMIANGVNLKSFYLQCRDEFSAQLVAILPPRPVKAHPKASEVPPNSTAGSLLSPIARFYSGKLNNKDLAALKLGTVQ